MISNNTIKPLMGLGFLCALICGKISAAQIGSIVPLADASDIMVNLRIELNEAIGTHLHENSLDSLEVLEVDILLSDIHRIHRPEYGVAFEGGFSARTHGNDQLPMILGDLFHIESLTAGEYRADFPLSGALSGFGERASRGALGLEWSREESQTIVTLVRLLPWLERPNAVRTEHDQPWNWVEGISLFNPNVYFVGATWGDANSILPSGNLPAGEIRMDSRSDLNIGVTAIEHFVTEMEKDPLTGALAATRATFAIEVDGWVQQRFSGTVSAEYNWIWRDEPPDLP